MKELNVGIIGAGLIASEVHIPNYLKSVKNVKIVAIADVIIEKAKQVAETYGIPNVFHSYENILKEVKLVSLSVCVPNKFHAEATIAALEAGCQDLCGKIPAMIAE